MIDPKALMKSVLETQKETGAGGSIFKWPQGKTEFRLLPFKDGRGVDQLFVTAAKHWFGDDDDRFVVKCVGGGCKICAKVDTLPKERRSAFRGKLQMFANAVVKTADGPKQEILPFSAGTVGSKKNKSFGAKLLGLIASQGEVLVLEHNFIVLRTGDGLQTTYEVQPVITKSTMDISDMLAEDLSGLVGDDPSVEDVEKALERIG